MAIVLALVWGTLHFLIVPRIDEFRPTIEKSLSHVTGVQVRIERIKALPGALVPSFELQNFRFLDAAGRDALVLKQVTASLSPRSVMHLGLEQLVIEQPELDIRRNPQGSIFVAGLEFSKPDEKQSKDNALADWFFSQRELVIRNGVLRWTDELRGAPPLTLNKVDFVARNSGRNHLLRLDATPQPQWGGAFSVMATMRHSLVGAPAGQWRDWVGDAYANFAHIDVAQLKQYANLGVDVQRGRGALRVWVALDRGLVSNATADLALADVSVRLASNLEPLSMSSVNGRLSGAQVAGGLRFATQALAFKTSDGVQWSGGNIAFLQTELEGVGGGVGELKADRLDLSVLAQIADRLPLGTATHSLVRSLSPKGLVETVQASWQGQINAPTSYRAQGKISGLNIQSAPATARPGIRGANLDFKINQSGGEAKVLVNNGVLDLPGAFEDPVLVLDTLTADAKWTVNGEKMDVRLSGVKFANADVQGDAQAHWQTADPGKSKSKSRFPGVLDLQSNILRMKVDRVYRYLPASLTQNTRDYVREAISQGSASAGRFTVKGDLADMPFTDPRLGEFRITAQIDNTVFAYVPTSIQDKVSLPWPPLTQLNGELVFDRVSIAVKAASGRIGDQNGVQFSKADAYIADMTQSTTVVVTADTKGAVKDILAVVNSSPIYEITSKSLAKTTASGNADMKLRLELPLFDLQQSKVQGSITLAGNDIQITPDTPLMARSAGLITFNERGFAIRDAQIRMFGGDLRLQGGTQADAGPTGATMVFEGQGTATVEAIRQAKEFGFISRMAQNASGSATYTATLGFRAGLAEIAVASNLQGMVLSLPAPLNKTAETALPLRYQNTLVRESLASGQKLQDRLLIDAGSIASIEFLRDISGAVPQVLRGAIGVGLAPGESVPPMDSGVAANINFAQVDLDAWGKVLTRAAGADLSPVQPVVSAVSANRQAQTEAAQSYIPSVIAVRARELTMQGRTLHNVVVGGSREGPTWRANLDARELNGYAEYSQPVGNNAGRVYARLTRLSIAQSDAVELEAALDEQPQAVPALDVVVEDFELRGKKLGRIEVDAVNRGSGLLVRDPTMREWRLNKLNVTVPEAQFSATGNWAAVGSASQATDSAQNARNERRRTVMNFKLDIADSGTLLKRFGLDKAIAKGKGKMEGQIAWLGSPLSLNFPSMGGSFNVDIEQGQFLQADPGIGKLLGVLSLQSLPRRLTLDFKDVFTEGFSFDFIRGDVKIDQGVAFTNNLQMKGVNAAVLMEGKSDLSKETQDIRVVVVPEINAGTASLIAAIINPAIGLGTFLAQLFLRRPLSEAATQEFHVTGTWSDIKFSKVERNPVAQPDNRNNENFGN